MTGRRVWPLLAFSVLVGCVGCVTYREDLNRGQRLYEENQYEKALAIWRVLEADADSLTRNDQGRYAYLRGMTDYRLGFRADARHWLAVARATEQEHPGGLSPEWKERLAKSIDELNQEVYGGDASATASDAATPAAAASGDAAKPPAAPPGTVTKPAAAPSGDAPASATPP